MVPFPAAALPHNAMPTLVRIALSACLIGALGAEETATVATETSLGLEVDGRDLPRGLLHARISIPATRGALVVVMPKWIPGTHAPSGRVDSLGGLRFSDDTGRPLPWLRDETDPYRFTVDLREPCRRVIAELVYIANNSDENSVGSDVQAGLEFAIINWNSCVLYPQGQAVAAIPVDCTLSLPEGWSYASRLEPASDRATMPGNVAFTRLSLRDLVDRPLVAGKNVTVCPLAGQAGPPVTMAFASTSDAFTVDPLWLSSSRRVVDETIALFGRAHYRSYTALIVGGRDALGLGLEHAESTLIGVGGTALSDLAKVGIWERQVFPHEYVHSWCGKHVRPDGMAPADFQEPLRTGLLWVYEGLTEYIGEIVSARAGLLPADEYRRQLAKTIHRQSLQPGRAWRSIEDTARASWQLRGYAQHWNGLRRGQEYYMEGALFWLACDLVIRRETKGAKSLDDFCRAFFGAPVETGACRTYTLADIVTALEAVAHYDWQGMIDRRLRLPAAELDTAFLADAGWRLAYSEDLPDSKRPGEDEDDESYLDATASLGCGFWGRMPAALVLGGPADRAGLCDLWKIDRIDDKPLTAQTLHDSLVAAKRDGTPIRMSARCGMTMRDFEIACDTGPRYPCLQRDEGREDVLEAILTARVKPAEQSATGK
jgi:predicted metalloprotease with PDZ domain